MKKVLLLLVVLAAGGGGAYWYFVLNAKKPEPIVNTGIVTRGNIVDTVGSTGQLQPVSQVVVGSQVSGVVLQLGADFNSIVTKGQVLAKLDPQTVQTQILQAEANVVRSQTDIDKAKVTLDDARKKYERSKDLSAKGIVTQADLDTAELNLHSAEAALKSSQAALQQSQASLEQNKVNLEHTIILSPIDGLVISRAVDVGQTVNASMNAPAIFTIAADLTKMKVIAGVDESDVGRIRPDQHVTFRVDAYPNEVFNGTVEQVRLEPKMPQNVVTYQTVISVPNPDLKLRPGMTANLNVEISRIDDVLRVPNAALRFRPTNDMYTALGLEPPADTGRGGRGGGRNAGGGGAGGPGREGAGGATAAGAAPGTGPAAARPAAPASGASAGAARQSANARPSGETTGRNGGGRGDFGAMTPEQMARLQNMTPEERDRMAAGRGGRGGDQSGFGSGNNGGRGDNRGGGQGGFGGQYGGGRTAGDRTSGNRNAGGRSGDGRGGNSQGRGGRSGTPSAEALAATRRSAGASTIDALFPALSRVETRGRAWTWDKEKKELKQVSLRLGISDGQNTQLIEGDLKEGAEILTNIIVTSVRTPLNQQQGNPFFQGPGGGRGGPGGFGQPGGGGGGGGGGNRGGGGGRGGF